ncbi:MAG: hypothetical protein ACXVBO_09355, partial [Isosphaeraceae bacterium]
VWFLDTTHAIGRRDGSNETCPSGELSFPDPAQLARPRHPLAGHVDVRPTAPSTPMYDTRAFCRDRLGRNDASYLSDAQKRQIAASPTAPASQPGENSDLGRRPRDR